MGVSYAEISDLEARWRPLTSEEEAVASVLLADATQMIRDRWPSIDADLAAGTRSIDTLIPIVCAMVKTAMQNPGNEGVESSTVQTGPFSDSRKYANPNGNLYLTGQMIQTLDGFNTRTAKVGWLC